MFELHKAVFIFVILALTATSGWGGPLVANRAVADEVFGWTDAEGRKVYGSRPPSSASAVQPVKKTTLSRYSSDKLLRRLGKSPANAEPRARISSGKSPAPPPAEVRETFNSIKLEQGDISIERNNEHRIIVCDVVVKNPAEIAAKDVSVAFEFSDGTLVPGVGPGEITAKGEATFSLPKELLPLKLKFPDPAEEKALLPPRVIIHAFAG